MDYFRQQQFPSQSLIINFLILQLAMTQMIRIFFILIFHLLIITLLPIIMIFGGYFICWLAVNGFNIIIYLLQSIVKKNPDFIFDGCYWYTDYLFDKGFQLPIIDSTYDYYDWIKGALDFWNTFSSWQNINGSFVAIYLGIFILFILGMIGEIKEKGWEYFENN